MERCDLEHIVRAAAVIADDDEIIIIGSQAILGSYPDAPFELKVSIEADVYPKNYVERWDLIDGCIGEGSPFHETFGYYAQGVDHTTATLPNNWQNRLSLIKNQNTRFASGYCLEPHDLAISKYIAGRQKDDLFNQALATYGYINRITLLERLNQTNISQEQKASIITKINTHFNYGGKIDK